MTDQNPFSSSIPSIGTRYRKSLSHEDRIEVFRIATRSLVHWHGDRFNDGMTTEELETALKQCLGIFGGCGGPNRLSVCYQGSGLKIWGGWHIVNHVQEAPLFQGKVTIAMAREVYGIVDPEDRQPNLL